MEDRLKKKVEPWDNAPDGLRRQDTPEVPSFLREALGRRDHFSVAFFVRMLFSCLVDSDFLDTEEFMDRRKAQTRPKWPEGALDQMRMALKRHLEQLSSDATKVDRERARVLEACLQAAERSPGLFSLTVPTGGGKTLSSLAFALRHAQRYNLRRVIYIAPFTSIIEQNADVFRKVFSPLVDAGLPDPVVEHHSSLDPDEETTASRMASENWDAPLVVSTGVQFYESLFANRASQCRKLHNLSRSVIILDEAQAVPVDFLEPCLRALDELCRNYGVTVVLCTATQPAVHQRAGFPIGLELSADREIIPDPKDLHLSLKRVDVEEAGLLGDEELAAGMLDEHQVLCIVNTRAHCQRVAEILGDRDGHVHLSALMCPAHRSEKLKQVHARLEDGRACRLVSTRLIEAGVDIDFPVVYRSMAGLDSIAQAAGRCNRNGKMSVGRTIVFESEHASTERFLADTAASARQVLSMHSDPLSPEAVEQYFRLYYWDQGDRWDAESILSEFRLDQNPDLPFLFGFASAARRFRLIKEPGRPVIIPWGEEGVRLCEQLRDCWEGHVSVELRRKLQRYTVQIPERVWTAHANRALELVHGHYPILVSPKVHYSDRTGLRLTSEAELLIA